MAGRSFIKERLESAARKAGASELLARRIRHGYASDAEFDELLMRKPDKAEAIAEIRERVNAERQRARTMDAARAVRYRTRRRAHRLSQDTRICVTCRTPLAGKREDARFCSDICRVRHHRAP